MEKNVISVSQMLKIFASEQSDGIDIYDSNETIINKYKEKGIIVNKKILNDCKGVLKKISQLENKETDIEKMHRILANLGIKTEIDTIEKCYARLSKKMKTNEEILKSIILRGYTIEQYTEENQTTSKEELYKTLDLFKAIAQRAKKRDGRICEDTELMEVLSIIDKRNNNTIESNKKYKIKKYLGGVRLSNRIDNLHLHVFANNESIKNNHLMYYILTKMKESGEILLDGKRDKEAYKQQRETLENKLDMIVTAIDKVRKTKEKKNEDKERE